MSRTLRTVASLSLLGVAACSSSGGAGSAADASGSTGGAANSAGGNGGGAGSGGGVGGGGAGNSSGDNAGGGGAAPGDCAKYCSCMATNCGATTFPSGGCLSACTTQTKWDLACRIVMCTLAPDQPNNNHCTHAAGELECLDAP